MTISDLVESPARMYLEGKPLSQIQKQSTFYQLDKKTIDSYDRALESFYSVLIEELKTQKQSVFSKEQWEGLTKSLIHIFLCLLIDTTITKSVIKKHTLKMVAAEDFVSYFQTQENLMQALPYDRNTRKLFFQAAWCLLHEKPFKLSKRVSFRDVYSFKNLKYFLAKKMRRGSNGLLSSSKPIIGAIGASQLLSHLGSSAHSRYTWIDMDPDIQSLYSFPSIPNIRLRRKLEKELQSVFLKINLPKYFPVLKNRKLSAASFAQLASVLLPIQSVEKFGNNVQKVKQVLTEMKPNVVITSTGPHDDLSSMFLSEAQKLQIPMISLQHGAGYSEYKSMQTERAIEMLLYQTRYLSWGKGIKNRIINPMISVHAIGSPYLNALPKYGFEYKTLKRILIPLEPIYYYQILDGFIPTQPGFLADNYSALFEALERIHLKYPQLSFVFKVKLGHERQYAIVRYASKALRQKITFSSEGKTYDYFDKETLILIPTLSGAFHEAVMSQVPFLLYMPEKQKWIHPKIDSFFEAVRSHHMGGASAMELVQGFDLHYEKKVDYKSMQKELKRFQEFASLSNPHWEADLIDQIEPHISSQPVIVLSGEHFVLKNGKLDINAIDNLDNTARIKKAVEVAKRSKDEQTLVLNGATTQLPFMRAIAMDFGFPDKKIICIDCTIDGMTNTKTQFEAIRSYYKSNMPRKLSIVTSSYHVLRAEKTAQKVFGSEVSLKMISAPYPGDASVLKQEELEKIKSYAAKGDLAS